MFNSKGVRRCCIGIWLGVAASAFASPPSASPQSSFLDEVQRLTIRVQGPARVGFPIWVHANLREELLARYPFNSDPGDFGSNRLELRRDGQPLTPHPPIEFAGSRLRGGLAGSLAPPGSPQNRLPLHLAFTIDRPGRYSVRWTVVYEDFTGRKTRERMLADSGWLDFDVVAATPAEREAWLTTTLAARPTDKGLYVGDYLPSLMAAVPDRRVAQAVMDGIFSREELIESWSRAALGRFPAPVSAPLVMDSIHQRGPIVELAAFVSGHVHWFQDRRDDIVPTAVSFLRSNDDAVVEGALHMLTTARRFDWKDDTASLHNADDAVEAAAALLATRGARVARTLAAYVPITANATTRDRLWRQVERKGPGREQALIALTWIADPADLSKLGDVLVQPGNPDSSGYGVAGLPYHLVRAYGEQTIPYVQKALAESPYVFVKTESAKELALKGRVEAFRFFLDAITAKRFYRDELVRWLRDAFNLPKDGGDAAVTSFLKERIRDPRAPAIHDDPLRIAVTRLQSNDAAVRKMAAQDLIGAARKSNQNTTNVGAYLIDDVIRKPSRVSSESWRDAALILARIPYSAAPVLTQYLERDGATAALIESGEPAVGAVADVLFVGGTPRRLLAARVLGAIGGVAARAALTAALQTESEASVKQAIQTALERFGQRASPAEIR